MQTIEETITEHVVPVLTGLQRQGDVVVAPLAPTSGGAPLPTVGVVLVEGRDGHTHLLVGDGLWTATPGAVSIGVLTVPPGGEAVVGHPEHADLRIGPGCYAVRAKRELAPGSLIERRVED